MLSSSLDMYLNNSTGAHGIIIQDSMLRLCIHSNVLCPLLLPNLATLAYPKTRLALGSNSAQALRQLSSAATDQSIFRPLDMASQAMKAEKYRL